MMDRWKKDMETGVQQTDEANEWDEWMTQRDEEVKHDKNRKGL